MTLVIAIGDIGVSAPWMTLSPPRRLQPGAVLVTSRRDELVDSPSSAANVHAGFTGHEHDPEHGFINMRGRIYDPELGRFTTPDPFVQAPLYSQSFNRYAYVFNNASFPASGLSEEFYGTFPTGNG